MSKSILAIVFAFIAICLAVKPLFASVLFEDNFSILPLTHWNETGGSWQVNGGKYGAYVPNNPSSATSYANIDITVPDYTIELDMYPVKGTDRNIRFRNGSNIGEYDLHFTSGGIATNFGVDNHSVILVNHPLSDNFSYHVKIVLADKNFKVYIDGGLIFDVTDNNYEFDGSEKFYLTVTTGGVPTEVYFDNISITTPDNSLNVPLYKQTDPLWANEIYDSAPNWQTNNRVTIGAIGCGITSAAMVFRYHGLTKMPDGITELTPKSLNDWMNSRLDRNFRNGNTNWESMSKNLSPLLAQINNVQFDSLEYEINSNQDNSILDTNLASGLPVILRVPNHFIVAKGKDTINNSYFINDPFYDKGSLSDYSDQYERMITYVPSNSDLSYMIFAVDPTVDMKLYDGQGNELDSAAVEFPIGDPLQLSTNLVGPLKFIQFAKPESGEYVLKVSANSSVNYLLDGYMYDEGDGTKLFTEKGVVGEGNEDIYNISFHKQNVDESVIENPSVSFDSLLADLDDLYKSGHIARKGSYNYLANKILQAKNYSITNIQRSKDLLLNIRQQLVDDKKRGIDVFASQYLIDQIDVLLTSY